MSRTRRSECNEVHEEASEDSRLWLKSAVADAMQKRVCDFCVMQLQLRLGRNCESLTFRVIPSSKE